MPKEIHKTAIVSKKAELGENVSIGPYCIVGDGVTIGDDCRLLSNVIVEGHTEIGSECTLYPFASVGLPPQDLKYRGEKTGVRIGRRNIIREYATVHRASSGAEGLTVLGDSNYLMAYVHIAHDCRIGNSVVMANAATLAGHVIIEDFVIMGGLIAVHQFTRIGSYAMVGGFSGVGQDIAPYTMASGARAKLYGLNVIGLKRHGFSDETINVLKKAYKLLFRENRTLREALKLIKTELPETKEIKHLVHFIEENKRGICR